MTATTLLLSLLLFFILPARALDPPRKVEGHARDAVTSEPLVGVTVLLKGTGRGAVTDARGYYCIGGIAGDSCTLVVRCVSYKTVELTRGLTGEITRVDVALESNVTTMDEVVVSTRARRNTETGMIRAIREMYQVASGVSAAQIAGTPDRLASEVIRRVSGVTIIDDRFIIARGLAPRYNATWINGMTLPGTENDGRAFPFDLVPGSQIDNLIVYKSPSPEIPADFSGAFVRVTSKDVPDENRVEVSYATGINTRARFKPTRSNPGSATDFLGFDASKRPLSAGFPARLGTVNDPGEIDRLTREGFNNDWRVKQSATLPDQRLSLVVARRVERGSARSLGNITAITYSYTFKRVEGMKNARYGIYSAAADAPVYLDDYTDNQYSRDARVGIMHNWALRLSPRHRLEWKNLFNILGTNRLTERTGIKDMSSMYYREQTEMRYTSRVAYAGQFSGRHELAAGRLLSWEAGYSRATRDEPDRRIITYHEGIGSPADIPAVVPVNESITRYFQHARDHGISLAVNYRHPLGATTLKTGLLGEYRDREHAPREFIYRYDKLTHEERQAYLRLPFEEMLDARYLGADKVYIDEITRKTNAYTATVRLAAAYAAVERAWGKVNLYAGARLEYYHARLSRDRSDAPGLTLETRRDERHVGLFPSVNASYAFSPRHLLRAAYGRSINRPELREVSPTVYYDFDLFSEIAGNEHLRHAAIDNVDLRYECYPAAGESLSLGIFYKRFKNPIEWTFIDMGGSLRYNYENAARAVALGVELDARRRLDGIGLPGFTAVLNLAWIKSNVRFRPGEIVSEPDRAMQGQSPYVVNAGLFYRRDGLQLSLLYNRVGKRIVGLGKSNSIQPDINTLVPDSYEMPRDLLDFSVRKTLGRRVELRGAVKDILASAVVYKQFPRFTSGGAVHERTQITRKYTPGSSLSLGLTITID
ncbi:MAG: TonB-dependent receptor [Odoribacteraceae bacterium]|nr:TonB-dependent receptor [Odoribacteraceae bacterium]